MAQNKYESFVSKVTKSIEKDKVIKELEQKNKSAYIKSAISIAKSAVFVKVYNDFKKQGYEIEFENLSKQDAKTLKPVMGIYKGIVSAIDHANKVLGRNVTIQKTQAKSTDFVM